MASTAVRNSPGKCVLKHPKHSLNLSQSCTKHNPLSPPPFLGCSDPNQHLAREKQERKSSSGVERGRDRAQKARPQTGIPDQPLITQTAAVLVHTGKWDTQGSSSSSGMLVPSSLRCSQGRDPETPTGSLQGSCCFSLLLLGFLLVIASLPGLLLTQQWESNCFVFIDTELSGQNFSNGDQGSALESKKINHLGLGSPLN